MKPRMRQRVRLGDAQAAEPVNGRQEMLLPSQRIKRKIERRQRTEDDPAGYSARAYESVSTRSTGASGAQQFGESIDERYSEPPTLTFWFYDDARRVDSCRHPVHNSEKELTRMGERPSNFRGTLSTVNFIRLHQKSWYNSQKTSLHVSPSAPMAFTPGRTTPPPSTALLFRSPTTPSVYVLPANSRLSRIHCAADCSSHALFGLSCCHLVCVRYSTAAEQCMVSNGLWNCPAPGRSYVGVLNSTYPIFRTNECASQLTTTLSFPPGPWVPLIRIGYRTRASHLPAVGTSAYINVATNPSSKRVYLGGEVDGTSAYSPKCASAVVCGVLARVWGAKQERELARRLSVRERPRHPNADLPIYPSHHRQRALYTSLFLSAAPDHTIHD
ncbi:hypothetical protein B0H12DRAFT_1222167 [Mycena haematopus]|nr:hypothetical protein B0H12DRAFT_1222167 [Mycena haematopus]